MSGMNANLNQSETSTTNTIPTMSALAAAYVAAKSDEDTAAAKAKLLGAALIQSMTDGGVLALDVSGTKIARLAETSSSSLDLSAAASMIEQMNDVINLLASRLSAMGEDVVLPDGLGVLALKVSHRAASLRITRAK